MGWAARSNPMAHAARRREIAPKAKALREHFKRPDFKAMWAKFTERLRAERGEQQKAGR